MSLSQSILHANISERLTCESSRRKTRETKAPKILLPQAEKKNCTPPLRTSDFTRLETILSHPEWKNIIEKYNKKISVALANVYDIVKDTVITWTTATLSRLSEIIFFCVTKERLVVLNSIWSPYQKIKTYLLTTNTSITRNLNINQQLSPEYHEAEGGVHQQTESINKKLIMKNPQKCRAYFIPTCDEAQKFLLDLGTG